MNEEKPDCELCQCDLLPRQVGVDYDYEGAVLAMANIWYSCVCGDKSEIRGFEIREETDMYVFLKATMMALDDCFEFRELTT